MAFFKGDMKTMTVGDYTYAVNGIPKDVKDAILACFDHVEWADNQGQESLADLRAILNGEHNYLNDAVRVYQNAILYTNNEGSGYYQLISEQGQTSYIIPLSEGTYSLQIITDLSSGDTVKIGNEYLRNLSTGASEYILSSEIPMTDASSTQKANATFLPATSISQFDDEDVGAKHSYGIVFTFDVDGYVALPLPTYRSSRWVLTRRDDLS